MGAGTERQFLDASAKEEEKMGIVASTWVREKTMNHGVALSMVADTQPRCSREVGTIATRMRWRGVVRMMASSTLPMNLRSTTETSPRTSGLRRKTASTSDMTGTTNSTQLRSFVHST